MAASRAIEKSLLWVVKIGLWIIPVLPLYVSSSMLFPFITGKNFAFRIIIELLFALWVALAVAKREYRPVLSLPFKAATVFILILFLADLLSPNPYRAFFSNYERMEGFMMLGHLYLYFVMLTSVFKTRRDWLIFFHATLAVSVVVSYLALLQKLGYRISLQGGFRVDSTIGNPTYLAAYLLLHIWLLGLLFYRFWKERWLSSVYGAVFIFELAILYFTATRGAVLALLAVAIPFLGAAVLFWPRLFAGAAKSPGQPLERGYGFGMGRTIAAVALALVLAVPIIGWAIRGVPSVQKNKVLGRLTSYSLQERTIQSRFKIWRMSAKAALKRPMLGWGQENYYLVFQKYFDPRLYAQEPWFDRSHNIIFDWLIHAGFLGLLSYLGIFGAVFWKLISGMRRRTIVMWEGMVVIGMFLTYFLQNLFVFDNLNTYLLFFAVLAYANYLGGYSPEIAAGSLGPRNLGIPHRGIPPGNHFPAHAGGSAAVLLLLVFIGGYFLHIKPIRESKALIDALRTYPAGSMEQTVEAFRRALRYRSFGDTEVREQLSNIARGVLDEGRFTPEERKKFLIFAIDELRKETDRPAKDVKHLLFLGALLNRAAGVDPQYADEARRVLEEAIRVSPGKQIIYFELAQFYLSSGNIDRTIEVLEHAWDLDRSYQEAGVNLLLIAVLSKKPEVAARVEPFIDFQLVNEPLLYRLGLVYQRTEGFRAALEIYKELVGRSPKDPKYRAAYAALLAHFGKIEEARVHAEEAVKLDPEFAKEAKVFLEMLKEAR